MEWGTANPLDSGSGKARYPGLHEPVWALREDGGALVLGISWTWRQGSRSPLLRVIVAIQAIRMQRSLRRLWTRVAPHHARVRMVIPVKDGVTKPLASGLGNWSVGKEQCSRAKAALGCRSHRVGLQRVHQHPSRSRWQLMSAAPHPINLCRSKYDFIPGAAPAQSHHLILYILPLCPSREACFAQPLGSIIWMSLTG